MSRILKRPMFRRGGSTNTGIMSGITDRTNYQLGGIDKERLKGSATAIQSLLNELSPVPKTRLPIGQFGLNIASGMSLTDALRDPLTQFTKADDIRRAQLAKRGQGAVSTALNMELARLKNQQKTTRTLTEPEIKKLNLPKGTIAQTDSQGKINVVSKPSAKEVEKRADLTGTIGLLNKVEENYLKAGKPVGPIFNLDPDRLVGTLQQFTGGEKGKTLANLEADIKKTTTFLTKAISGAQVSDKEREFIEKLIPQLSDTEVVFEAKLKSLRSYLGDAVKNYGGDIEALMKAGDADDSLSAKNYILTTEKDLDNMSDQELEQLYDRLKKEQLQP
tara:strand:+ start:38 stop:1036 length:999 start_codon:yes stop_codon:yes gene_type:complete